MHTTHFDLPSLQFAIALVKYLKHLTCPALKNMNPSNNPEEKKKKKITTKIFGLKNFCSKMNYLLFLLV